MGRITKAGYYHVAGRLRPAIVEDYEYLRDLGYTDTEMIHEGIRLMKRKIDRERVSITI
jgi:hypothetical protein